MKAQKDGYAFLGGKGIVEGIVFEGEGLVEGGDLIDGEEEGNESSEESKC